VILGAIDESGRNSSLDGQANIGVLTGHSRTIRGKSRKPLPFSRIGLIMGDFCLGGFWIIKGGAREKQAPPGGREKHAYFFSKIEPLAGND
jgi:hypothetical protein